jgi:hypothetical protein
MLGNRANQARQGGKLPDEISSKTSDDRALCRLRPSSLKMAAPCRTRHDLGLPTYLIAADWLQLPAPAHLLRLRRRSNRTFRVVGGRMDDAGAAVALPTLGQFRNRQRAADETARRAMVSAMAVRTMARRQCAVKVFPRCALSERNARIAKRRCRAKHCPVSR